jgi:ATP-dependent RNA helicase DDX18/HAS1
MKKHIHNNKQNEKLGIISGSNIEQQLRVMNLPDRSPHKRYNGYQHMFITVNEDHRFLVLYTFLQKYSEEYLGHRIILFFFTNESTVYYTMLLRRLKFDVDAVYVGMTTLQITNTLNKFAAKDNNDGIIDSSIGDAGSRSKILCIPNSLGKDIIIPPSTNWIVQFEPCSDPSEYIYRIGRVSHTHGGSSGSGSTHQQQQYHRRSKSLDSHSQQQQQQSPPILARALLFLTPNQFDFHKYYKAARIKVYEYEIPTLRKIQSRYLDLLKQDDSVSLVIDSSSRSRSNGGGCKMKLRQAGEEAYFAYLSAYAHHEYKDIYDKNNLDVKKVALCFGFDKPPLKKYKSKSQSSSILHNRETTASLWMPMKNNKKDGTGRSWMK